MPGRARRIVLHVEEWRPNHSYGDHRQAKVDEVAAVTLPVALEEHIQRDRVRLSVAVPHMYTAPDFVENRSCSKGANGKCNIGPDIVNTRERQHSSTGCGSKCRNAKISPQCAR